MTLEDHIGDILRKARQTKNVSVEQAATAAGLNVADYTALEASGKASRNINFATIGGLIGLDGAKLERIAKGWLPSSVDLSQWRELRAFTTTSDDITVNAYLVWDEVTREGALFDTGWDAKPIIDTVQKENVQLRHLFITHAHPDHIEAIPALREAFPKLRLHSGSKNAPPDQRNRANDFLHVGSLRITNRETPGHAEDGVTYVIGGFPEDAPYVAVVGDCIFAGSMGRGNQSAELLQQKVREQIFSLPPATLICPGHGPLTTVEQEKANNPFF